MTYISKLLDPKNDYVFKRIFGYMGNESITKGLLEAILDIHIKSLQLDCKEILEKDLNSDKLGILDIRAIINDNIQCNIEMQIVDRKNIVNRILAYWSKLYNQSIQEGKDYNTAQKAIIILIIDYSIDGIKEIQKYLTKWQIREQEYSHIALTDKLEICIIELPKFKEDIKPKLSP